MSEEGETLGPDDPTPDPERKPGIGAAEKVLPIGHHAVSELRKLLVPVAAAFVSALAAGGFAEWRAGNAQVEAVRQAEEKILESEQRAAELEKLRTEIRKELLKGASWDEVGTSLVIDKAKVLEGLLARPGGETTEELKVLVERQALEIQAQTSLPPRPGAAVTPR